MFSKLLKATGLLIFPYKIKRVTNIIGSIIYDERRCKNFIDTCTGVVGKNKIAYLLHRSKCERKNYAIRCWRRNWKGLETVSRAPASDLIAAGHREITYEFLYSHLYILHRDDSSPFYDLYNTLYKAFCVLFKLKTKKKKIISISKYRL